MKKMNIKIKTWIMIAGAVIVMSIIMNSCAQNQKIVTKSGAKLWVENCQRCHNTPSPTSFSHEQWVTVGMHMQTRAQLTDKEIDKIVKFLSQ